MGWAQGIGGLAVGTSANAVAGGFDAELASALARKMGLRLQLVLVSSGTASAAAPGPGVDAVLSMRSTAVPPNARLVAVTHSGLGVLVPLTSAGPSFRVRSLQDLCGRRVAAIVPSPAEGELNLANGPSGACAGRPLKVQPVADALEGSEDVRVHLAEVLVDDAGVAAHEPGITAPLAPAGVIRIAGDQGVGVRGDDPAMSKALFGSLAAVERDGTYDRLLRRWQVNNLDIRS